MKCRMFVKALILLLSCIFSSASGKVFSEKTILLEFKYSVSDPSGILSNWHPNTSSHCSWFGISCSSESRVVSVNITGGDVSEGNKQTFSSCSKFSQFPFYGFGTRRRACLHGNGKLAGKLSPLLGKLSELRVLSLAFNDFSGEIPVGIWGLEKLEVLDLEGNLLNGRLPNEFVGLRKLRVLNLGFNRFSGEIPSFLKKCEGLEVLNLAGNKLEGSIPGFVGDFLKLRVLYLSYNELNGSIPSELGSNCLYLEHLDLSGNFLVGRIPGSLGKCRQLRTLLLFSNMLIDFIPRELGRLRKLEVLDVSRNRLDGLIPTELGNCVELSVIVLSNLFDPLPSGSNTRGELSVGLSSPCGDNNSFHGSIPMEITTLSKLRILWAPKVNLEGKLPSSWGACESLEMLNLAQNLLRGELVGVFDRCKRLHFIDLSSNELSGKLDVKLQVPCMTLFDVSGNHMSGSIPKFDDNVCPQLPLLSSDLLRACNPSFTYMSYFMNKARLGTPLLISAARLVIIHNFSWNNFTGPIHWLPVAPERLGRQTDYAFLAGANKLTGSFLGSLFGKCNKLHGMIANLSNNNIVGHIPLNIGSMCKSLRVLDVSHNHISGIVPPSLGNLKSLVFLDLSGNRLQGQVPDSLHRLKYLRHLSLAGNNLTGGIPSSIGQLRSPEVLELSSNSLSGEVPEHVAKLRNLTALLLNNNKLSRHIPSGLAHVRLLSTFNASFNNLSGSFPWNDTVMNCNGVVGTPLLDSRRKLSVAISPSEHNNTYENSQNSITAPTGSRTEDRGINSIEIASIVSASAILSVLLVLVILFFYTRKWVPDSRVQGSESRELTLFVDTGVPLTYESIVQATGNFNSRNCIGSGGFGATYKAEISPGILVAVKRLSIGRFHGVQQFHAEIKTLGSVRHPNLVTLIGYQASENEMFLIYNYLPGGNLENFIKERSARAIEWRILHKIALDIASALAYLHDQCAPRVLHRDVKPSNILLDDNFNAYLSDFGLSRLLGTSETHATTGVAGTFGYVAPEYALTCRVSEKADVYSYGVMLLELISDKKALDPSFSSQANGFNIISWAWMLLRQSQAKDVFTAGLWDTGPHDDLVDMLHLALKCTIDTLSTRPTMKQVVQSLKQIQPASS